MSWLSRRRTAPLIGVVVPAYDVADYLPACLDSLLAQTHRELDIVVVDDGSPDASGDIAERYAARDSRVRVLHLDNRGLGGARNEGLRHVRGEWLTFADSDDVVPPTAYAALLRQARRTRADLVTGDVARLVGDEVRRLRWSQRLHEGPTVLRIAERPELLGDVFAWNKLYRREFWARLGLSWPERIRYEDQPTTTRAFVAAARIGIVPEVVYHWRDRDDGTSISQQRASIADLEDRWTTKRMALETVLATEDRDLAYALRMRVLPGDLWRYFRLIPDADDAWWELLVAGVREFWGAEHSLARSSMLPVDRLTGWLVEQDRRDDAALVRRYRATHEGPLPRVTLEDGSVGISVPGLDESTVALEARRLHDGET